MTAQGFPIKVEDVHMRTATVQVKSLTLDRRQVTLAVFRQLRSEEWPATDEGLALVWGFVNYHPDKCDREREHLHIVWQKEVELRRAIYPKPVPFNTVTSPYTTHRDSWSCRSSACSEASHYEWKDKFDLDRVKRIQEHEFRIWEALQGKPHLFIAI